MIPTGVLNMMRGSFGMAGGGMSPDPIQGQPRQFMPGPMADVPYMPQAQVGPQQIARYVDPRSIEGQKMSMAGGRSMGVPQMNFMQRLLMGMQGLGQMRNPMVWQMLMRMRNGAGMGGPMSAPRHPIQHPAGVQVMGQPAQNFGMMG